MISEGSTPSGHRFSVSNLAACLSFGFSSIGNDFLGFSIPILILLNLDSDIFKFFFFLSLLLLQYFAIVSLDHLIGFSELLVFADESEAAWTVLAAKLSLSNNTSELIDFFVKLVDCALAQKMRRIAVVLLLLSFSESLR